ncbi:MAG: hypothetical protein ACI8W8_004788, partial [Rhodothermales bacterium]
MSTLPAWLIIAGSLCGIAGATAALDRASYDILLHETVAAGAWRTWFVAAAVIAWGLVIRVLGRGLAPLRIANAVWPVVLLMPLPLL